jgi:hypothetical protein
MSVQVKRRRDTAANVAAYTGAPGELIVDTTNNRVTVHDGATPGGWPAAKLSEILTGTASLTPIAQGANGAAIEFQVIEQTVVLSSGTSVTAGTPIPANCIVLGIGCRVLTAIAGAPAFNVGVSGNATQFGGSLAVAAGSTNYGIVGPYGNYSATNILVASTGAAFTGGQVRLSVHIMLINPPTS